jgi:biotin-dependent carboxylase-like uncharacterized protein
MREAPALRIVEPGLCTTLQDLGRFGAQRYGISPSGAIDVDALALANALVENPTACAALEIRIKGPTIEVVAESVRVALAGAAAAIKVKHASTGVIDSIVVGPERWRSMRLLQGDQLVIGVLGGSATAYLAIEGGYGTSPVFGSSSTHLRAGFGGLDGAISGRALRANDHVAIQKAHVSERRERTVSASDLIPAITNDPIDVRVVLGPQDDYFTDAAVQLFLSTVWPVSQRLDRMGIRLDGPPLEHKMRADIISDGIVTGAIQVPGNGLPIILLADRQTTGGYTKIASVISADLGKVGRARPDDRLRFHAIAPKDAITAARDAAVRRLAVIDAIGWYHEPGALDLQKLARENLITAAIDIH